MHWTYGQTDVPRREHGERLAAANFDVEANAHFAHLHFALRQKYNNMFEYNF